MFIIPKYFHIAMLSQLLLTTNMHIIRNSHVLNLVIKVSHLPIILFQRNLLIICMNRCFWFIVDRVTLMKLSILLLAYNVVKDSIWNTSFVIITIVTVLRLLFCQQIEFILAISEVFGNINMCVSFCSWILILNTLLNFHLILIQVIWRYLLWCALIVFKILRWFIFSL